MGTLLSQPSPTRWYHEFGPKRWQTALIASVTFFVITLFQIFEWDERVGERVIRPIEFWLRSTLSLDPRLDPSLVVFAISDSDVAKLQHDDLSLSEWKNIFLALHSAKPRSVFIDKVFGTPQGIDDAAHFSKSLVNLGYPLITGAFVAPVAIPNRPTLDLTSEVHRLSFWTDEKEGVDRYLTTAAVAYGAHPDLRGVFRSSGHLNFEGRTWVPAFFKLREGAILPFAPLLIADKRTFSPNGLLLQNQSVPITRNGRIYLNYILPKKLIRSIQPISSLIERVQEKDALDDLAGKNIVILTGLYSGTNQVLATPIGNQPAGFVILSALNSVLSGNWVHYWSFRFIPVLIAVLAGWYSGAIAPFRRKHWFAFGLSVFGVAIGFLSFTYFNHDIPWAATLLGFGIPYLSIALLSTIQTTLQARRIYEAFEGLVPEPLLQTVAQQPGTSFLAPSAKVVTIMFIDIVGFSKMAESRSPMEVFSSLRDVLRELTSLIQNAGGIIDRTLGDGVLCYFSSHEGGENPQNHADRAVNCAIEIQKLVIKKIIDSDSGSGRVFPLRIGINTGAVVMGDVGNFRRIDMTLIGHVVNMAKRLESACELGCLMSSQTTRDMLLSHDLQKAPFRKRLIPVKHFAEPLLAFELDPFHEDEETRKKFIEQYRKSLGIFQKEKRSQLTEGAVFMDTRRFGRAQVQDFSESGMAVRLESYLGHGLLFDAVLRWPPGLEPSDKNHPFLRAWQTEGITLVVEIRWGRPLDDFTFVHGILIRNLSEEQKAILSRELGRLKKESADQKAA